MLRSAPSDLSRSNSFNVQRVWQCLALTAGFVFAAPSAGQVLPADRTEFPTLSITAPLAGQAAILALGTDLPSVAAYYRMAPDALIELLNNDHTARIDSSGRVFFVEDRMAAQSRSSESVVYSNAESFDPARTFELSSLPGSSRTIYLDFDGHSISGEEWNGGATINARAWDVDGRSDRFSTEELRTIQNVWQRVAEDFAPFDVNVTTREPSEDDLIRYDRADTTFGTRVVITPNTFYNCDCGGVAYLSVFDHFGSNPGRYQPAWVFNRSEDTIAEAASHEAGHNLGLRHDGTESNTYYRGHGSGAVSWAPIMGISYGKRVTHWSRGEYAGANNTQDDIATIPNNGAPMRADDAGDVWTAAGQLDGSAQQNVIRVAQTGTISSANDIDMFMFVAGAGPANFLLEPGPVHPNLDINVSVVDDSGVVVAVSSPNDRLGAGLSVDLAGGTYYLMLDGVGTGDPSVAYSDYGSIGTYRITGEYRETDVEPPVASFTLSPSDASTPQLVSVDASDSIDPDGEIVSYTWDFGDGRIATGPQAYCAFAQPGTYSVTLTIRDNDGLGGAQTKPLRVDASLPTSSLASITAAGTDSALTNQCTPGESQRDDGSTSDSTGDSGFDDDAGEPISGNNDSLSDDVVPAAAGGSGTPSPMLLLLLAFAGLMNRARHATGAKQARAG